MVFTTDQRTVLSRFLASKATDMIIDFIEMSDEAQLDTLRAFAHAERAIVLAQREAMAASLAEFDAMIAQMGEI